MKRRLDRPVSEHQNRVYGHDVIHCENEFPAPAAEEDKDGVRCAGRGCV